LFGSIGAAEMTNGNNLRRLLLTGPQVSSTKMSFVEVLVSI